MLYVGYEDIIEPVGEFIKEAMLTCGLLDGLVELIDTTHQTALAAPEIGGYATVSERFTREETAQLQANILYDIGLGDFAMISLSYLKDDVENRNGSWSQLYEGVLGVNTKNMVIPINSGIMILTLPGSHIKDLIEHGISVTNEITGKTDSFKYFWSGKLNVNELGMDQIYTVVFPARDYTEETAALGNPVDSGLVYRDVCGVHGEE